MLGFDETLQQILSESVCDLGVYKLVHTFLL